MFTRAYVTIRVLPVLMIALFLGGCNQQAENKDNTSAQTARESGMPQLTTGQVPFATISGDTASLSDYSGKVVRIVNVASKCGYTEQYAGLEKLYRTFKDSGLVILGFPANNFGGQEPGTNEEILKFCTSKFDVSFPMMAKISVSGGDKHPLFTRLTEGWSVPGEIKWNFSKSLLDREGTLIARFGSGTKPLSDELQGEIEKLL